LGGAAVCDTGVGTGGLVQQSAIRTGGYASGRGARLVGKSVGRAGRHAFVGSFCLVLALTVCTGSHTLSRRNCHVNVSTRTDSNASVGGDLSINKFAIRTNREALLGTSGDIHELGALASGHTSGRSLSYIFKIRVAAVTDTGVGGGCQVDKLRLSAGSHTLSGSASGVLVGLTRA
jgi:hypothetical protein